MSEYYSDQPSSAAARVGQRIYHEALSARRGFRPDQIGIPEEDDVWIEIFENIGRVASQGARQ
jgi:hypothetical protein